MKLKALLMSAATAALFAGAATAQDDTTGGGSGGDAAAQEEQSTDGGTATGSGDSGSGSGDGAGGGETGEAEFTSIEEMTVGDVTGMSVFDPEGARIGEVDYVIDQGNGAQAVIGIGGFLGIGEYTVAIPVSDFELQQDPMGFGLDTDRETLEQQPEFDESTAEPLPDDMMMSDLMSDGSGSSDTGTSGASGAASGDTSGTGTAGETGSGDAMQGGDTGSGESMESGDTGSGDAMNGGDTGSGDGASGDAAGGSGDGGDTTSN